jgi:hypothetical protein
MLIGQLDVLTSSGYADGWAYDDKAPGKPLALSLRSEGVEVAQGIANRYRADLAEAGCGTGWCGFRFRVTGAVGRLRRRPMSLVVIPDDQELYRSTTLALVEDNDLPLMRVDEITRADPTVVDSVEQLRGCGEIFASLIGNAGMETFIRAAYIYALGRPADNSGLEAYSRMIRDEELSPFGLLRALCDSDEFRSVPRLLIAPTEPGFIFSAL